MDTQPTQTLFRLTVSGDRTTEELVKLGGYGYATDSANSEKTPVRLTAQEEVTIEIIDAGIFVGDGTADEFIAALQSRGLRPSHEHALLFGIQYPEEQKKATIAFLEPLPKDGPMSCDYFLVLGTNEKDERTLDVCRYRKLWDYYSGPIRFAIVHPR